MMDGLLVLVAEMWYRIAAGGANFNPAEGLSINTVAAGVPSITALDSNVYVVWSGSTPGNVDILFRNLLMGDLILAHREFE